MKNPLRYQMTEYDCGPTSLLNAVGYLFEREDIPPEIVRNVMLYSLDCYGSDGISGKSGTSYMAMQFLSNWLNGFGQAGHLPISSQYLSGAEVDLSQNGRLCNALQQGGAAVVRIDLEGWHYVLMTAVRDGAVYLFDPYYQAKPFDNPAFQIIADHPMAYNRIIPISYLERPVCQVYALGPQDCREAVLLFNERTRLTAENTVEYMI